jgi:hypothetical protein
MSVNQVNRLFAIPITKVLQFYKIPLSTPYGGRIKIICPFHHETLPSFTIFINENNAHCFGCGQTYDSINIIQKRDGVRFSEAVEKLARIGGFVVAPSDIERVRKMVQRGRHKVKDGKGDEYFREFKQKLTTELVTWMCALPKRECFWHLTDYFWSVWDAIGEEKMGTKEVDFCKKLSVEAKEFFRVESLRWILFSHGLRPPRETWQERTGEWLGCY